MKPLFKLKVTVTKEHLRKSAYCGVHSDGTKKLTEHCAIAVSVREIFPKASVVIHGYYPFDTAVGAKHNGYNFISKFDRGTPEERINLPETEVELEITQEILDHLNQGTDWEKIINETPHLKLVEL